MRTAGLPSCGDRLLSISDQACSQRRVRRTVRSVCKAYVTQHGDDDFEVEIDPVSGFRGGLLSSRTDRPA